jgi:polyhydroxyalkanoate synthesis repressor PhaR
MTISVMEYPHIAWSPPRGVCLARTLTKGRTGRTAADRGAPLRLSLSQRVVTRIAVAARRRGAVLSARRSCRAARRNGAMDGSDAGGKVPITIKKYANRRLYNTAKSSYVTLEHLAQMVRDGDDFVVYDAKTGEDITRSVLAQIIFEEEAKGASMLPTSFLRQLIRLYGDTLQSFVPSYLEASMENFSQHQEKMREQVRAAFGPNPALEAYESMARANMEMFQNAMRMFAPAAAAPSPGAPGGGGEAKEDLDALKSRLAEMQKQLDAISREK